MLVSGSVSGFDNVSLVSSGCLSWLPGGAMAGRSTSGGRSGQCAAVITGVEETALVGAFADGWEVTGGEMTTSPGTAVVRAGCPGTRVGTRADGPAQAHSKAAHSSTRNWHIAAHTMRRLLLIGSSHCSVNASPTM